MTRPELSVATVSSIAVNTIPNLSQKLTPSPLILFTSHQALIASQDQWRSRHSQAVIYGTEKSTFFSFLSADFRPYLSEVSQLSPGPPFTVFVLGGRKYMDSF